MKKNEYKCDMCKDIFKETWSNEEALEEMKDIFGTVPEEERAIVCDDCYKKIMNYYTPWSTNEKD